MPSDQIPLLDLTRLEDHGPTVDALAEACEAWGLFYVVGHGLPDDLLAATHAQMRAFFGLPLASKRAIERTAENAWGFFDRELTKNVPDWKQIFDYGPDGGQHATRGNRAQWPADLPSFRPTIEAFYRACERLSFRLLAGIVRSLGTSAEGVAAGFAEHTSFLRLNCYPGCAEPAAPQAESGTGAHFGVNHHTDAGAITVLLQDARPGLQVFRQDEWRLVEPLSGSLVVNIGDIVQVWSNDRYRAPLHRVLASREWDRYSAPFFFNPSYDTLYQPLPSACGPSHPPRYRPIQWGEFRARRAAGDYADLGEEVQIAHYRIPSAASRAEAS